MSRVRHNPGHSYGFTVDENQGGPSIVSQISAWNTLRRKSGKPTLVYEAMQGVRIATTGETVPIVKVVGERGGMTEGTYRMLEELLQEIAPGQIVDYHVGTERWLDNIPANT